MAAIKNRCASPPMKTAVAIDTSQSANNTAQSNQSIENPLVYRASPKYPLFRRADGGLLFHAHFMPLRAGFNLRASAPAPALPPLQRRCGGSIDTVVILCILQNMDFNATPISLTPSNCVSIWRSSRVAMRRNMAVCTQAHSKHAGSGSGLL